MTYKELLESISFEEIVPFIEKYHGGKGCQALYKIHYDMLRHLVPNPEDAYYKTATVSHGEQDEDWPEPHLAVHPIEGQIWEGALTMELVIEPDVTEPLAEIAACCLWHTSFYGFTEEQTKAKFESWERQISDEEYQCQQAQKWVKMVKDAGGSVPTEKELMAVPSFQNKVKASKVSVIQEYWKRMGITAEFVANNLPAESDIVNLPIEDLCKLFYANHYIEYDYKSYCDDEDIRADYLIELIDRYEAFEYGILPNALIVLSTSKKYPLLMEEMREAEHIAEMSKGVIRFIVKTDDTLEKELRMNIAFYEYEEKKAEQYRKMES